MKKRSFVATLVLAVAFGSAAQAGWVVRSYHDNGFMERVGGLWTNETDRLTFDANWLLKTPQHPMGMSFCARTGFTTKTAGRHTFTLDVAERDKRGHFLVVDGRHVIEFPDGIELAAGRHTLALYVRDALGNAPGTPWIDCAVKMDGQPLANLTFNAADEAAESVTYDRVFNPDEGLQIWAPTWRSFDFDVPEDGLYEIPVRYRDFPRYTRIWIDDVQVLYNQGRNNVDTGASFRGDLDRTERTDRQRINFFGEDRVIRFLTKGKHRIDLYAHWGPWVWDDEMNLANGRIVFGLRRLRGVNPESEAGFWIEGTDQPVFAQGEAAHLVAQSAAKERRDYVLETWCNDGTAASAAAREKTAFTLADAKAVRLALPTTSEGEWRYVVKNARGDVIDGPWEYAVIATKPEAAGHIRPPVVVDRVDCTEGAGGPHLFRERGASALVTLPDGTYRRVGLQGLGEAKYKWIKGSHPQKGLRLVKEGEKPDVSYTTHDWYAYTLKVKNPGRAHILRCKVPNDEYRLTTVVAYDRKTRNYNGFGMLSGDAPASGAFSDLDIFLWPNSDVIDVMVINSEGNHGSKLNRAGAVQSMELLEYPDGLPPLAAPAHGWNKTREFGLRGEQVDLGFNERTWPDFIGDKPRGKVLPNAYTWRPFLQAWDRFGQIGAWRGDNLCQFPVFTYMMVQFQAPESKILPTGSDRYTQTQDRNGQEMVDRTDRDLFLVMLCESSKYGVKMMADFMIQRVTPETIACWARRYGTHTNGMMLATTVDGKPYQSFSLATFPNPAHPAVRKAYVEFCEGMGRRYGKYSAFGGIANRFWRHWPASFESWFYNDELGYDDFTVGEFSRTTGVKLDPVGTNATAFAARRELLKTKWRREWFDWRTKVCLTLREEMLAALKKYAPQAQFLIADSHDEYKKNSPGSGLDGDVFEGRRDLGFVANRAVVGIGGDVYGVEFNNLDPVCFAAFDLRPEAERNETLANWTRRTMDYPQGACCDGTMRPYPYTLEPAALALADNRLEYFTTFGNWTLPPADSRLREFVRAYRAIPDGVDWVRYDLPGGTEAPIALWQGKLADGTFVFWIVNRTDAVRTPKIKFDVWFPFVKDYVTGKGTRDFSVPPFGVRIFASKRAKAIASVEIPMPEAEKASVKAQFAFIESRRPFAAGMREIQESKGEIYYERARALGHYDASWTFDDLYLPMARAAKAGDWHEVRRLLGDFQTNHRWWFETLGWPADFCKVRTTGRGPLVGFRSNRYEITFPKTNELSFATLPYAKDEFVTSPQGKPLMIHQHGSPGGRGTIELTGVFGGGYGDIEVTVNGMNCGIIRSTSVEPRLESRTIPLDYPQSGHGTDIVLTAKGEKGLAILSLQRKALPMRPIDKWQVIGPFDKGGGTRDEASFAKTFPPEEKVDFKATYTGVDGKKLAWKTVDAKGQRAMDMVALAPYNVADENGVAYLVTYVKVKNHCWTMLGYTNDYFGTIWLNGVPIVPKMNGPLGSYALKEVKLNPGWNEIKVKTACGSARTWYFGAAIADDGTFEYSATPPSKAK